MDRVMTGMMGWRRALLARPATRRRSLILALIIALQLFFSGLHHHALLAHADHWMSCELDAQIGSAALPVFVAPVLLALPAFVPLILAPVEAPRRTWRFRLAWSAAP